MMKQFRVLIGMIATTVAASASGTPPRWVEFEGHLRSAAKSGCENGQAQLFISEPKTGTLIYQVDVIPNGSFEFKLKPGKYLVRGVSSAGCEGVYALEADGTKRIVQEVVLTKKPGGKS